MGCQYWVSELDLHAMEGWSVLVWLFQFSFTLCRWPGVCAPFTWAIDGTSMHWGWKRRNSDWDALWNVLLVNPKVWHTCGCEFHTCHPPEHPCRPSTPLHGNGTPLHGNITPQWQWSPVHPATVHITPMHPATEHIRAEGVALASSSTDFSPNEDVQCL